MAMALAIGSASGLARAAAPFTVATELESTIAERWASAVSSLGRNGRDDDARTSSVESRLGGIYALERIARR